MKNTITIHAAGCCLIDYLYTGIDFSSEAFKKFQDHGGEIHSKGGLQPGKLVFSEDLEQFSGMKFDDILKEILENGGNGGTMADGREKKLPETKNLGGPAIIALMNAAQLLAGGPYPVETGFWGVTGKDETANELSRYLQRTPISRIHMKETDTPSANTVVLSDPNYKVHGERAFINTIGAAGEIGPEDIPDEFFDADIVLFGGTGLVPKLHDNLTALLKKAKERGCFTVVGTVYDFRNQKKNPSAHWPLGEGNSYPYIDLLIMDEEESRRLTGKKSRPEVIQELRDRGSQAFIITEGAHSVYAHAEGAMWKPFSGSQRVCDEITDELIAHPERRGDTTGCGDNYLGGVIADIALQLREQQEQIPEKRGPGNSRRRRGQRQLRFDILRAHMVGAVSGGYACFYTGGAFFESSAAEKRSLMQKYFPIHCEELGIDIPDNWRK